MFYCIFNSKKILSSCTPVYCLVYPLGCRNPNLKTTALQTKAVRYEIHCPMSRQKDASVLIYTVHVPKDRYLLHTFNLLYVCGWLQAEVVHSWTGSKKLLQDWHLKIKKLLGIHTPNSTSFEGHKDIKCLTACLWGIYALQQFNVSVL